MKTNEIKEIVVVICHRCKHEWNSKTKAYVVTCPFCGTKVRTRKNVIGATNDTKE